MRAIMAGVGSPWPAMESSPERGKRGKGKRGEEAGGTTWGAARGHHSLVAHAAALDRSARG
jgi:hypothetical protein